MWPCEAILSAVLGPRMGPRDLCSSAPSLSSVLTYKTVLLLCLVTSMWTVLRSPCSQLPQAPDPFFSPFSSPEKKLDCPNQSQILAPTSQTGRKLAGYPNTQTWPLGATLRCQVLTTKESDHWAMQLPHVVSTVTSESLPPAWTPHF